MTNLTPASLELFTALANDAGNWSGTPMFEGGQKEKGNLADLKKKGLLKTQTEEGCTWVFFTEEGKVFGEANGIDMTHAYICKPRVAA